VMSRGSILAKAVSTRRRLFNFDRVSLCPLLLLREP
jgi:hypothetical protein